MFLLVYRRRRDGQRALGQAGTLLATARFFSCCLSASELASGLRHSRAVSEPAENDALWRCPPHAQIAASAAYAAASSRERRFATDALLYRRNATYTCRQATLWPRTSPGCRLRTPPTQFVASAPAALRSRHRVRCALPLGENAMSDRSRVSRSWLLTASVSGACAPTQHLQRSSPCSCLRRELCCTQHRCLPTKVRRARPLLPAAAADLRRCRFSCQLLP